MFISFNSAKASIIFNNRSLTSTFSALCIVKVRIFSIFSISKSVNSFSYFDLSLFSAIFRFLKHASTTVFPVITILLRDMLSLNRFIADSSVGTKYNFEDTSAAFRLISSGIVSSNDLNLLQHALQEYVILQQLMLLLKQH